jgi:ornithine carbamoyltransferase
MNRSGNQALLAQAQALQHAARAGQALLLLKGRRLALLCEDRQTTEAQRFQQAAAALGAHVAHVRPSLSALSNPQDVQHTARMLGRLYDAVECQGMPAGVVRQLGEYAGVPVFDGLARGAPAAAGRDPAPAPPPAGPAAPGSPDLSMFMLQAQLLQAMA